MRFAARIYFALLLATLASGQTAEPPPAFEAASVKLNTGAAMYFNAGPGEIEMRNYTLQMLIFMAYRVSGYSLSAPAWIDTVRLDVVAKLPASAAALSPQDRARMTGLMLQGLLADRFKLKIHQEEKIMSGYALVVASGGLKMQRVETPGPGSVSAGLITSKGLPLAQIVASAGGALGVPVHDMTGLSGNYEFTLKWTPDVATPPGADNASAVPEDRPPDIFTALQDQLGLKLEPRKFPIQTVIVDHVERVPSDN